MTPSLLTITRNDMTALARILSRVDRSDPYSVSAGYYAVTGRKGLWLYGDDTTAMMVARHPNDATRLLFFPPFGKRPQQLLQTALSDPRFADSQIDLARIAQEDMIWAGQFGEPETENLLDWTYPVHVLDVAKVAAHKGDGFKDFRKNLNRADRAGYTSRSLDLSHDQPSIMALAYQWAEKYPQQDFDLADLIGPSAAGLSLTGTLPIAGVGIFQGCDMEGFALWEETSKDKGLASGITSFTSSEHKGASEFLYQAMCQTLQDKGFKELCIGGSETASLDAFKRKMQPVKSIPLMTTQNIAGQFVEIKSASFMLAA